MSSEFEGPRVGHIWVKFRPRIGHIKPQDLAAVKEEEKKVSGVDTPIEIVGFLLPHAAGTLHCWVFHFRSISHAAGLLPVTAATFRP